MKIPLTGFMPDAAPSTPGVITDCTNMIPTVRGMKGGPAPVSAGADALAAACIGSALGVKLDSTYRVFAGTAGKLYELSGTTWTDRTRAVGGDYTTGASGRWRFAQFGDTALATNGADTLQSSTSGAFADISGAPEADCIDTVAGFVMLGATNDATNGDQADRWYCSAFNDSTDWTPSIATQCATGRLVDSPGPITAIRRLGYDVVAYKSRSLYIGTYSGAPAVWEFRLVPGDIGAPSQEAVVNIGSAHIFVGYEDIYLFDGSRPIPIGDGIREWFFSDLNKQYRHQIIGSHDFINALVYFYYPSNSSGSGAIDSCIVYSYKTQKWGRVNRAIEAAVEYLTGQVTYATIGDHFASYAAISGVSYDSPFWSSTAPVVGIIDTTHTLYSLTGDSVSCDFTTGIIGDDGVFTLLERVRPRFINDPTTATMINYQSNTTGGSMTEDATTTMDSGKFDVLRSARWHKLKQSFTGQVEISGNDITLTPDGEE